MEGAKPFQTLGNYVKHQQLLLAEIARCIMDSGVLEAAVPESDLTHWAEPRTLLELTK